MNIINILTRYGLLGTLNLMFYKMRGAFFSREIRLMRFPIDIRNKKNIKFGKGLTTGKYCRIEAHPENESSKEKIIQFGKNVQINDNVHIVGKEKIIIEDNVLMASKIFISDLNHGNYKDPHHSSPKIPPSERRLYSSPIIIKKNVWLGEYVCVMPGTIIGEGSIIGAMSVVTKDIPDYCIAVGSPAKVIKRYNFETKKWEKTYE